MKKKSQNKRNTVRITTIILESCFIILISIFLLLYYLANQSYTNKTTIFTIEKGMSITSITNELKANDIILSTRLFYLASYILHMCDITPKAGEYSFPPDMSSIDILYIITKGKTLKHKVTIPEGYTVKKIIELLTKNQTIEADHKISSNTLNLFAEGTLMPDTYIYQSKSTAINILNRMQTSMNSYIYEQWNQRDTKIDGVIQSPREALILASIVECEALLNKEKPRIAGVYLNRLKQNIPLQSDPTVIYGITNKHKCNGIKLLHKDLKIKSESNTYLYKGLPKTAISNPGKSSILAVLQPEWHSYLYFVAAQNGQHLFSSNFQEHLENIKKIRLKKIKPKKVLE